MLKAILLASSLLWLSSNLTAQENGSTQIKRAYLKGDFIELLKIYNTYPEYKVQIEDALLLSIEEKELSYEECLAGMKYCKSNRELSNFFNKLSQEKTLEITKKISEMTMEEIDAYIKSHPERRFIVENLLNTFIDTSADTITLLELNYIQRTLPQIRPTQIQQYLNQKNEEKRDILLNNIYWFLNNEKRLLKNLHYAIERSALEFLYNGYRQVAIYYAKIGMIPDNIDAAEKQYRLLVNACIPEKALQRRLQEEADKFCKEINLARNFFSKQLGKENDFIKMEISIPLYSVNHTTPSVDLSSIEVARKEFINSKNMNTNMCSAANSVGLGIIGLIGKGIIDVNAVDDLIIREIAARKRYMKNVLVNLEKSILNQNASTRKKIESYVIENQKNFKIHANK